MTLLEAKQKLAKKLDIDYSDIANNDLFSDDDLSEYLADSCQEAYNFAFWDYSEHSKIATLESDDLTAGYVPYPNDILPSSLWYLKINGKEFKRRSFTGYQRYFEENPTATDRFFTEFKRSIFFNANATSAGQSIEVFGKRSWQKISADADLMPFSPDTDDQENSGNSAIVTLAYSKALSSEKLKNSTQGAIEEKRAYGIFGALKKQVDESRALEQSSNTPMFNVPDFFKGNNGASDQGRFSRN